MIFQKSGKMHIACDAMLSLLTIVSIHIVLKLRWQVCMKVYLAMDGVTIQCCEDVFAVAKMIYMQCSLSSTKYIACNVQYCFITHWLYQHQHCIANVSFNTNIPCLLVILSLQGLMKKCLFAGFWKSFTKDETQSKMCDIKKDSRHRVLFKLFLFRHKFIECWWQSHQQKKAMKIESTVFLKLHYQRWRLDFKQYKLFKSSNS